MILNITEAQAKQIMANAINASSPMGMGILHFEDKKYSSDDIEFDESGKIYLDYFNGRMVKFGVSKKGDGYMFRDIDPRPDYQSWATQYPTVQSLIESVIDPTDI